MKIAKRKKTHRQKLYSALGFWKYTLSVQEGDFVTEYLVIYWCMFPHWFIKKFDVFKRLVRQYKMSEELARLNNLLDNQ